MHSDKASRSVAGLTVLITGGASGMGRATAHLFAQEGANVAVTDISAGGADAVARDIVAAGGNARAWALDVTEADAIRTVVDEAAATFGSLDILINNAGIAFVVAIDAPDYEEAWDRMVSTLLTGQQRLIRAALPHLRRSPSPRIVNIASTEALGATAAFSPYCAAKAGVTGLTRALAVELGPEGITVNCVCPGPIHTGLNAFIPEQDKIVYGKRRTALKRYGEPEEVAHMILSLCLPAASYVTGVSIPVDGGLMARNG